MYEYRFETVEFSGMMAPKCEAHREIIERLAALGWRFVGQIPTRKGSYGAITAMDLIFEREVGKPV